jgi:methionine-rich copper-binding protein CopC
MSLRTKVAVVAAAMIAVPGLWFVATVSAHATIGTVAWNDASNPTKVIATSRGDDIRNEAGTYGLQVFDPSGKEITVGPTVITGPKTMEGAVSKPAAQGQYRVAWKTRSAEPDAHDASGNLSLQLNAVSSAPAAPAATAPTTAPVSPPSTGDGGLLNRRSSVPATQALILGSAIGALAFMSRRSATSK